MGSRTLLQLFTLLIITLKQIEAKSINKTDAKPDKVEKILNNLDKPECIVSNTSVKKYPLKANESVINDTVLLKKTHTDYIQQHDINIEPKHDFVTRNKNDIKGNHMHNEENDSNKSQEQESNEYLKPSTPFTRPPVRKELTSLHNRKHFSNDKKHSGRSRHVNSDNRLSETMKQNAAFKKINKKSAIELDPNEESSSKDDVQKKINPKGQLRKRRHGQISTTLPMTVKPLISKAVHRMAAEIDSDILCTIKHCDFDNHRSIEKISQEYEIYRLKRRDKIKQASSQTQRLPPHKSKRYRSFTKPISDNESKLKQSYQIDGISKENEIYKLKNLNDIESLEFPVKKQMIAKNKHNFQKKKRYDKVFKRIVHKIKDKQKTKHDVEVSNKDKHKPPLKGNKEKHNDLRHEECSDEKSRHTFKPGHVTSNKFNCDSDKEIESQSEEHIQENDSFKPILPFYISSTTTKSDLKGNNDLAKKYIDINETIDRLASSKILDLLTDRVAGEMLKKLQNSLALRNHIATTKPEPEKVEKINILFQNDGDMVLLNGEKVIENYNDPPLGVVE